MRYDNRDVGLSTHLAPEARYTLDDMADDAAGLLDALGFAAAHVMGMSMGGMIAQTLAIRHAERVLSLVSVMSNTGAPGVGQPDPEIIPALIERPPSDRDGWIDHKLNGRRQFASPGFPFDEDRVRARLRREYDRDHDESGPMRQAMAIVSSGDRTERLGELRVPTVVVHGDADRLVHVSGGEATAAAIPGAELVRVPGMGHDLPQGVWPVIYDAVDRAAAAAKAS